jgi:hypothetical protein
VTDRDDVVSFVRSQPIAPREGYPASDREGRLLRQPAAQQAAGDRRLLYLAWLLSVDAGVLEADEREPTVPVRVDVAPSAALAELDRRRV